MLRILQTLVDLLKKVPIAWILTPPWRHAWVSRLFRNWWFEILSGLLHVVAFSGLVSVLHQYQNQPLPKWPLGLTINTALSVFAAVFKGALLLVAGEGIGQLKWIWVFSERRCLGDITTYDEASRGPLGATKLLWLARWRQKRAFLGASLVLLAFGIDPFAQAVVSYYECSVSVKGTSTVGRLNSYFKMGLTGYSLPGSLRGAIDASFGDSTTLMPNYTCSSDFCSFLEPYHSMGLCSKCTDVTDQLHTACWDPEIGGGCNYTSTTPPDSSGYGRNTTARYVPSQKTDFEWYVLVSGKTHDSIFEGKLVPAGRNGTPPYLSSTIDLVSASPVLGCRCSLYWCIRTYTATVNSSILSETLQSTSSNWSYYADNAPVWGTVKVDCLTPKVQSRLLSDGYISKETEWMAWNGSYLDGTESQDQISSSTNLTIPIECSYQAQLLSGYLSPSTSEFFSDPILGILRGEGPQSRINLWPGSPGVLLELYNNGSITIDSINAAFNNFTTVVSNYLRNSGQAIPRDPNPYLPSGETRKQPENAVHGIPSDWNQPATGEVFTKTTCIHVRWPWLALPAGLFVATLVFLVIVIAQTANEKGAPVWKSSQLAMLWHGLVGSAKDENLGTVEEMEQRAKQLTVKLEDTSPGRKQLVLR
ncbi:hypothetical protein BU16DRAFT_613705 [Lophium mytilinum]|uniref:Uncharacterized protein n=1 Tax=Lophium mytilinum TaxID=390894 RepID=A0A6A6RDR3_9PEZI|nr:hypothetical protein BU16DRAFT_613705 [Lophium mytilinum]